MTSSPTYRVHIKLLPQSRTFSSEHHSTSCPPLMKRLYEPPSFPGQSWLKWLFPVEAPFLPEMCTHVYFLYVQWINTKDLTAFHTQLRRITAVGHFYHQQAARLACDCRPLSFCKLRSGGRSSDTSPCVISGIQIGVSSSHKQRRVGVLVLLVP